MHWSLLFAFVRVDYKLQRTHILWTIFMFTHIYNVKKKMVYIPFCNNMRMYTHTWKLNGQYFFCLAFNINDPGIHGFDWRNRNESAIGILLMLRAHIQIIQSHIYILISSLYYKLFGILYTCKVPSLTNKI